MLQGFLYHAISMADASSIGGPRPRQLGKGTLPISSKTWLLRIEASRFWSLGLAQTSRTEGEWVTDSKAGLEGLI